MELEKSLNEYLEKIEKYLKTTDCIRACGHCQRD